LLSGRLVVDGSTVKTILPRWRATRARLNKILAVDEVSEETELEGPIRFGLLVRPTFRLATRALLAALCNSGVTNLRCSRTPKYDVAGVQHDGVGAD
jgi:hypothetical protein